MCLMDTCNETYPSTEQETEKSEKLPMEKTVYVPSRPPLHDFKLPGPGWTTRKVFQCDETRPDIKKKPVRVFKPCLRVKQSTRQPVNKGCEVVRERSRVRRREGLFSMSLSKEEIEEDFVRVIGRVPQGKKKVKKIFETDEEEQKYINYLKYLRELNPGNWLSEIYHV
ncbi:hypothetical protein DCAR_0729549 [Daucus carota subsp. sativus]|uniref:Uncharacterized protein n=1 Tax=Daucus carota subsp. sativus TaxID=79200 RepID=A0A161ZQB3_DAUCS|nr:hypothetical protein DCAR_0729549 [Daucus carota subsp. sativus]